MTDRPPALPLAFRPDIEGLRGIAVGLVVVYHAGLGLIPGGYIGVDLFFVLSGFLISWLLVEEAKRSSGINLMAFYARRARRLIPAAGLVVVVTSVAAYWLYPPLQHSTIALSALSTSAYFSNFYFIYLVRDYFAPGADANPFLHTWSLSVEEQFYLMWPLLILFGLWIRSALKMRDRTILLIAMGAVLVASLALSLLLAEYRLSWTFFLSPTRAWEFACGGVAALLARHWIEDSRRGMASRRVMLQVLASGCLVVITASALMLNDATPFPSYYALPPVLATAVLLYCCTVESGLVAGRILANPVLRRVGLVSYSWYLWHWPFFALYSASQGAPSVINSISLLAVSYAVAEASHRFVETPARSHPYLVKSNARSLSLIAGLVVLGLVIVSIQPILPLGSKADIHHELERIRFKDANPLLALNCVALQDERKASPCSFGVPGAARTVVLLGDSHMAQWFPVVEMLAQKHGWHLLTMVKTACPYADIDIVREDNKRPYRECTDWRADALRRIDELKPYLVIAASSFFYEVSPEDWRDGSARSFARLSKASEHILYIRDNPRPGFSVPFCISRHLWINDSLDADTCAFQGGTSLGTQVYSAQSQAAKAFSNVQTIDLTEDICPEKRCPTVNGELVIYRDNNHLSGMFIRSLGPKFEALVMRALAHE